VQDELQEPDQRYADQFAQKLIHREFRYAVIEYGATERKPAESYRIKHHQPSQRMVPHFEIVLPVEEKACGYSAYDTDVVGRHVVHIDPLNQYGVYEKVENRGTNPDHPVYDHVVKTGEKCLYEFFQCHLGELGDWDRTSHATTFSCRLA